MSYIPGSIPQKTLRALGEIRTELFARITTVVPFRIVKKVGQVEHASRLVWKHNYHADGGDGCTTPQQIGPFPYSHAVYDVDRKGLSLEQYRAIRALATCPDCGIGVTLRLDPPKPQESDFKYVCPWCQQGANSRTVKLTNLGREKVKCEVSHVNGFATQKELIAHLKAHCQDHRDIPDVVNQRVTTSLADWNRQVALHSKPTIHSADIKGRFSAADLNPWYCSGSAPIRVSKPFPGVKDLSGQMREQTRHDLPNAWLKNGKPFEFTPEQLAKNQAEHESLLVAAPRKFECVTVSLACSDSKWCGGMIVERVCNVPVGTSIGKPTFSCRYCTGNGVRNRHGKRIKYQAGDLK